MKAGLLALLIGLWSVGTPLGVWAEAGEGNNPPPIYQSQDVNPFGPPSGAINLGMYTGYNPNALAKITSPTDLQTKNFQGCGGVSQGDYTSGLYYMPEVFGKFQQDVNSPLAKQLLTFNYSMPQTAALFDTLSNYGNARYQQFQQSCSLSALQKDAKQQFLSACVTQKLIDERKKKVEEAGTTLQSEQKEQLAYAQAWEICAAQYTSNTTIATVNTFDTFKKTNKAFADDVVANQNLKTALKPLLCVKQTGDPLESGCWHMLMLPDVQLCADATLTKEGDTKGCSDGKTYGVREAPVNVSMFFDLMRYATSQGMVSKTLMPLLQKIQDAGLDANLKRLAAQDAVYKYGQDAPVTATLDDSIKPFQRTYLACASSDVSKQLTLWVDALKARAKDVGNESVNITVDTFGNADYTNMVDKMTYLNTSSENATDANAKKSLAALAEAAAGCSVIKHVPMFDPNLIAALGECSDKDLKAFYIMASYDAALQATRDTYGYLLLRLKQVYGQVLSNAAVPGTANTISPAMNEKLATAVKEVWIPAVENQLERLDKLNANRGQFAQRVQSIYTNRRGCVNIVGGDFGGEGFSAGGGFGGEGFTTGGGF